MNENLKGYYLNKTGDRVKQLLDRQFIVPTLDSIPNSQTKTWQDGEYTVTFRIGELCRINVNSEWVFYRLHDVINDEYVWQKANTAEIPDLSNYATKTYVENYINNIPTPDVGDQIAAALIDYVKKVEGKGLSTHDFTDELKIKLEGITPYDPSGLEADIYKLETTLNALIGGDTNNTIESFNEIINFLKNVSDTESLSGIIAGINARIAEVDGKIPTKTSELKNDSGFLTEHQDISNLATKEELKNKVDRVNGKQLSTEDFTTALKNKLNGLANYDDTFISDALNKLRSDFDTLVSGDTTTAIKTFNEVIAFLDGISDSEDLDSIIASIEQQIAIKYSKPNNGIPKSDLANNIQLSLDKADTALQEHQSLSDYVTKDELNKKAEGAIETLDNGNIKVTINGVSKDFMPATPSGDPMHHYYESLGAQWNDGEDKTLQIPIYGKDFNTTDYFPVVHKSKRWYFNLLGDITNAQMANIVSYPRTIYGAYAYANCKARTIVYEGTGTGASVVYDYFGTRSNIQALYTKSAMYPTSTKNLFYAAVSIKYILGLPGSDRGYFIGYEGVNSAYNDCFRNLIEIRIMSAKKDIKFQASSSLSKTSILFMVNEATPTAAITITLHPTAYARVANDEEVIAALDAKNAALQGTGGSVSIVSA